jgi:hypothetical protein
MRTLQVFDALQVGRVSALSGSWSLAHDLEGERWGFGRRPSVSPSSEKPPPACTIMWTCGWTEPQVWRTERNPMRALDAELQVLAVAAR